MVRLETNPNPGENFKASKIWGWVLTQLVQDTKFMVYEEKTCTNSRYSKSVWTDGFPMHDWSRSKRWVSCTVSFINPSRENSQPFFPYEQLNSVGFLLLSL